MTPTSEVRKLRQILYVEDSDESRALVRRLLSDKFIVLEAADPLDGLHLAEETHPDLILLDHMLPHMSGREAATRLKKTLPGTPIVIVSADVSRDARERALAAGAAGFIAKPLDDDFEQLIEEYLNGRVDTLDDRERYMQAYQQELVERLEENVRQLSSTAEKNKHLLQQNERMLALLERRHRMLETAARVGQVVTFILDLDELLKRTVDIICSEFSFYYSGMFLVSEDGESAELRAGYAAAGRRMIADHYQLPINGVSTVGEVIRTQSARIVSGEATDFNNPYLPNTRSEVTMPLAVEGRALGALTVQSDQPQAFTEEDITVLQTMADQIAIAINNAQSMRKLEAASAELLRTKTFEAIATATGEAIHWVGNKAAPIAGAAKRLREDVTLLLALAARENDSAEKNESLNAALLRVRQEATSLGLDLKNSLEQFSKMDSQRAQAVLSAESLLEDLEIIENSAQTILNIKEGLIGPARQRSDQAVSLRAMIENTVANMGLPAGVVEFEWAANLPDALVDERQIEQVFNNLLKNAWEALAESVSPKIFVRGRRDERPDLVLISISDNGPGIQKEIQEKIWVSFFTTKGGRGGTGLGLSAVMQIVNQHGGRISLRSEAGHGATFDVRLPAAKK